MKPAKNHGITVSTNIAIQRERERLLVERQRIMARLQRLDEQEISSYIRAPYVDLMKAGTELR
jgi:hypothetical protein